jgi:protein subunit release factor A
MPGRAPSQESIPRHARCRRDYWPPSRRNRPQARTRKLQIGRAIAERIRTYNFPQDNTITAST